MRTRSKFCIIGIPDHQGVINVRGRVGAAFGPQAFRRTFKTLKGRTPLHTVCSDLGDVQGLQGDIRLNHELASDFITRAHRDFPVSIVIGGGHDHGYSQLLGIKKALPKKVRLGCINIDAHLDVRKAEPVATSGSPFFLAIENGVLEPGRFLEFGIQSHCNSRELWDYTKKKKVRIIQFDQLRNGTAGAIFRKELARLSRTCDALVLQIDLDSLAMAFAPGVSAPQAQGFTPMEVIEMAQTAARSAKVISLGIFELNPIHDLSDQTSRIASTLAYHFIENKLYGIPSRN